MRRSIVEGGKNPRLKLRPVVHKAMKRPGPPVAANLGSARQRRTWLGRSR